MLLKLSISSNKSRVIFKSAITFGNDCCDIAEFFSSRNVEKEVIMEVRTGENFSNLSSLDLTVLDQITLKDLKETVGRAMLHIKVIVR